MIAFAPRTLAEAVEALAARPGAVLAAGCTDLLVGLTAGGTPARDAVTGVVDVLGIAELKSIRPVDGGLELGAAVTFSEIRRSPDVARVAPALAAAARLVGGWQIQNRATLGGNIANASPAGDSLPVLLALDASVIAVGPAGEREIRYRDLHVGYRRTALAANEILARVRLPEPRPGARQSFRKVGAREAQAISKVVAALAARLEDGRLADVRVAAGSVAATPVRLTAVEAALEGRALDGVLADEAGERAAAAVEPIDDVRSTADYRRWVLGRVVRRMVLELGGEQPGR